MEPTGRGAVIMKVMEARKAIPTPGYEEEAEGGNPGDKVREHCQKGLSMAQEYMENEGEDSPLRPKIEALAAAYEDLLASMGEAESEEKE